MNMSDDRLVAYVDGELSDKERAQVEAYLADNPRQAQRVLDWQKNDHALRDAFALDADEMQEPRIEYAAQNDNVRWQQLTKYALAACLFLAIGFGGGLSLSLLPIGPPEKYQVQVAAWANEAHEIFAVDVNRPGEFDSSSSAHAENWLRERIGVNVKVPDLSNDELEFVGIRLVGQGGEPAALMTFETASAQRISIFVRSNEQPPKESGYWFFHGEDKTTCVWLNEKLAFSVTGELSDGALKSIALKMVDSLGMSYVRDI